MAMTQIEMQAMNAVIGIHRELQKANSTDARRYEIATSLLSSGNFTPKQAVEQADKLIEEIQRTSKY